MCTNAVAAATERLAAFWATLLAVGAGEVDAGFVEAVSVLADLALIAVDLETGVNGADTSAAYKACAATHGETGVLTLSFDTGVALVAAHLKARIGDAGALLADFASGTADHEAGDHCFVFAGAQPALLAVVTGDTFARVILALSADANLITFALDAATHDGVFILADAICTNLTLRADQPGAEIFEAVTIFTEVAA